jgi:hypothetical protein
MIVLSISRYRSGFALQLWHAAVDHPSSHVKRAAMLLVTVLLLLRTAPLLFRCDSAKHHQHQGRVYPSRWPGLVQAVPPRIL